MDDLQGGPFTLVEVLAFRRLVLVLCLPFGAWAQGAFHIHGYIQGRFTNQEGTPDRLEVRRARVILSGDPLSNLSYTVQGDLAKQPYLMDAAVTWKFSRAFRVTGGQFKIPFSMESLLSDNLNIPIARARAVNGLVPGRDTGVQGRDVGVQISGAFVQNSHPIIEYAAGVFRGQTFVDAPLAHYHATAGRLLVHPIPALTIGGDWYGSFSAPAHKEKRREEVEAAYDRGRLHIHSEQIWGRDGTLERRGGYALGAWRLSRYWETLTRADWLTSDIHKTNSTSTAYLAGLNFYWTNHAKIGANTGAQYDQGPKGASPLFLAQIMLSF